MKKKKKKKKEKKKKKKKKTADRRPSPRGRKARGDTEGGGEKTRDGRQKRREDLPDFLRHVYEAGAKHAINLINLGRRLHKPRLMKLMENI